MDGIVCESGVGIGPGDGATYRARARSTSTIHEHATSTTTYPFACAGFAPFGLRARKTVIGDVLVIAEPAERDAGTVACIVQGMQQGAHIFRVHNVRAASQAVRMIGAIESSSAV